MHPLLNVQTALFDLDGTLVKTHIDFPAMRRKVVQLAGQFGVAEELLVEVDSLAVIGSAAERLNESDRNRFFAAAECLLVQIEVDQCAFPERIPGALELLTLLERVGVRIGIVTRNSRQVSLNLLSSAMLPYHVLVAREDTVKTKPDPEHIRVALSALQHSGSAVMIGDHPMDVLAGRRAGLTTIGVLAGQSPDHFYFSPPDVVVAELHELLGYHK